MDDHHDQIGPVDFLVVEFPGSQMTGEGLPILVDLVDRGVIRVLDLVFVRKDSDGAVAVLSTADRSAELAVFDGASSDLLSPDDIDEVGAVLTAGSSAAILIYENRWAAPMVAALLRGGAEVVAGGRIPLQDIVSVLDGRDY